MTSRNYHVVAMSLPIVYTLEGDHDPDGMAFVLKPVSHLLQWAKERWDHNNKLLPRLHHKRQRAQLVIDGLERLDLMLQRLRGGNDEDHRLLAELLLSEQGLSNRHEENTSPTGSARDKAVRRNVQNQLEELRIALADLGDVGVPGAAQPMPVNAEPTVESDIELVNISSAERMQWRDHWIEQARMLDRAMEQWFERLERDSGLTTAFEQLHDDCGIALEDIKRLLLNDYKPFSDRSKAPDRFNPLKPIPGLRPLVLRACHGEEVKITFENSIRGRRVGLHLQGDGIASPAGEGVAYADGTYLKHNRDSTCAYGNQKIFKLKADRQGIWPINDLADVRGNDRGTNSHGLFGTLIVEPAGSRWHDPVTGNDLTDKDWCSQLDVMIRIAGEDINDPLHKKYVDFHHDNVERSFREFTVFIHDEPSIHSGLHTIGEHTVMPLSYRAEPMHNRLPHRVRAYAHATRLKPLPTQIDDIDRTAVKWDLSDELAEEFWTARNSQGRFLERVSGEEQHHSSWLFGDPITHILRNYAGDPYRIRLVHAGVKETHVFHLHVHQWRAVACDVAEPSVHGADASGNPKHKGSHLLDSITISPQTSMTIDPQFGAGSRQHTMGDVIWHCHLYPHFHHGMWGLLRSYDKLIDGSRAYPDGSFCPPLKPLWGRIPASPTALHPGFPWFIDGVFPMKSPPPPAARHEHANGRRLLLKMPDASTLEREAMPPACRTGEQPGAVFVDLNGKAAQWNQEAGLPVPRIIHYTCEMLASRVNYNVDGWHDAIGHHYRLTRVEIKEVDAAGHYQVTHSEVFEQTPDANPQTFFPRANHGDVVEWEYINLVNSFPADDFDLPQHPVECGMHVHLVKFDVLAADGSATGWNYLSGASCREAVGQDQPGEKRIVSLHRWVVDEEFGPCFFHDHLLANYRQKHGLFAALIAEPHGSQWRRADDQSLRAWAETEAVIVPPTSSGLPPFREACLGIGDFIPLLDKNRKPLNPPGELSGDDDPGSMAVNYRSAPMTFRGPDPSLWFSSNEQSRENFAGERGDPDTPVIRSYPGERLRIRLIQGSHEEQHSFTLHGMRWRRDWGNAKSPLVNQQSLGISEAFTLDINSADASPYGVGDHLWHFSSMDDIWLGCWGIVRVLPPTASSFAKWAPLPSLTHTPAQARQKLQQAKAIPPQPKPDNSSVRSFVVVAQRTEHRYAGRALTDPWGLIYRTMPYTQRANDKALASGIWPVARVDRSDQPLVLRARRGEWIRVILVNDLLGDSDDDVNDGSIELGVEPSPPRLPLESQNELTWPDKRTMSARVSIHASLLSYDVQNHDGSYVGCNPDTTVGTGRRMRDDHGLHGGEEASTVIHRHDHHNRRNWREYWWYADAALAPEKHQDGCGQVSYLYDMADIRNHRHHGLVGALVVLPGDITPFKPSAVANAAKQGNGWSGVQAQLRDSKTGKLVAHESVLFMQDGLRFFVHGDPARPVPDENPTDDPEDSGQKAINYRSHPVYQGTVARDATTPLPIASIKAGQKLWLRVIGAGDKPRQQSLSIHGCAWPEAPWMGASAWTGATGGFAPCRAENWQLTLAYKGNYAARAGVFRWASEHGVWTYLRAT
jgi:manganese oxidase